MTTPVTICDDSSFARKQLARALPENWDVEVTFAVNGLEGIEAVRENKAEVMFLDLTMPKMDGFEVLAAIQEEQLDSVVIVISGDIQPEARARVMDLGAIDFVKKPVDSEQMLEILNNFGLVSDTLEESNQSLVEASVADVSLSQVYQEIANIAMGQAADLLAQHLDAFIVLPVPSVGVIEATELQMMLQSVGDAAHTSAVFQGFIGDRIAGEALLIFDKANFEDIARLLKFEGEISRNVEIELMMDIASILIGTFLKAYFKILDVQFSQSHPKLLARNHIRDLTRPKEIPWNKTLSIEINYGVEDHELNCDLLILFAEDSIEIMDSRVNYYAS
ncbi:MAG: response regulator [Gammaproteobacteria bacterium]|nr:response regulator [Gammaproteobacteria bacterium]